MTFVQYERPSEPQDRRDLEEALLQVIRDAKKGEQSLPNEDWQWEIHVADDAVLKCEVGIRGEHVRPQLQYDGIHWRLFGIRATKHICRGARGSQLVVKQPLTTVYPGPPLVRVEVPDGGDM